MTINVNATLTVLFDGRLESEREGGGRRGPGLFDERLRKANVACISLTASSIEMPDPSLRISTPKILDAAWAPYSLEPARVMSKGRIWSEYQGVASSCRPPTSDNVRLSISSMVAPTEGPIERMIELVKMARPSTDES